MRVIVFCPTIMSTANPIYDTLKYLDEDDIIMDYLGLAPRRAGPGLPGWLHRRRQTVTVTMESPFLNQ